MRPPRLLRAACAVYTLGSFLIACSSPAAGPPIVPAPNVASKKSASAFFVITVPSSPTSSIRPHYVSLATKSISIVVSRSGKLVLTKAANLTPKSPGCEKVSTGTRCTIAGISLAVGSYVAEITAYSGTNERGQILSHVQSVPFTLKGGAPKKIAFTMDGVPASFKVAPSSSTVSGSAAKGFTIGPDGVWGSAQTFLVTPIDPDGDAIVGAGAPHLSVVSSNSAFTLLPPVGAEQTFSVIPPQNAQGAATRITLKASYADKSVCTQRGAHCVLSINLVYAPFVSDDWITFAHDFRRTGAETQSTGISAANVSTLAQRWKVNIPDGVYSSPVVYKGNVIVVSYSGIVYDLSAADGSVLWKTTISSAEYENTRSSPMIDSADGLVFMGTWYGMNGKIEAPRPSHFFALRLSDGSIAWQAVMPGYIHDAPVYENGVVYEGWSGGDPPSCINGGVNAFNAKTGAVNWTWLVNPVTNPGGGGGVWGALAWDGSHLVFGTGNTCQGEAWDQGAVALNPDGSMAWHYQADPTYTDDNDTGGGVCIVNNTATFLNKNGSIYTLDATSGHSLITTPLGGLQGHATPTTDGSTFVVGTGLFAASSSAQKLPRAKAKGRGASASLVAYVKAISASGTALWAIPTSHANNSYAAINNGVAYVGIDDSLEAISLESGTILAQFPGASYFEAGAVIVPSGLYFADRAGYVYAYSLPQAGGTTEQRVKR